MVGWYSRLLDFPFLLDSVFGGTVTLGWLWDKGLTLGMEGAGERYNDLAQARTASGQGGCGRHCGARPRSSVRE